MLAYQADDPPDTETEPTDSIKDQENKQFIGFSIYRITTCADSLEMSIKRP